MLVTLTFWRPQRRPIPPETAQWIDIGRLNYTAGPGDGSSCQQSDFSETDPNLRPLTKADVGNNNYFGVKDLAPDRPANPVNTFTYTLNLTRCLASGGTSFNPGETRTFSFPTISPNGGDGAEQNLSFKRQ